MAAVRQSTAKTVRKDFENILMLRAESDRRPDCGLMNANQHDKYAAANVDLRELQAVLYRAVAKNAGSPRILETHGSDLKPRPVATSKSGFNVICISYSFIHLIIWCVGEDTFYNDGCNYSRSAQGSRYSSIRP